MPATKSNYTFSQRLLTWFDVHGRKDLPWQQNKTPYRVWVSEIMLQQTQVATVIAYYHRFMEKFPTVVALANAEQDEVLHLWTGLGYYARARNLHKAAQMVRDDFNGEFPLTIEGLVSLPGIGRSTAAAVLSIANNLPEVILDGNVKRVLGRYFAVEGYPGNKKVEGSMWLMAQSLKPESRFADYTQAIMDLGATLCTRSKPKCETCPAVTECLAYAQGRQTEFPHKKPKKQIPTKTTLMLVPFYQGSVLLEKRPLSGIWGGLYGMLETSDKDLDSSILGLIGKAAFEKRILSKFTHTFSHFHLVITPILIALQKPPEQTVHQVSEVARLWYNIEQPSNVGLSAPTLKIFKQITDLI